MKNYSNEEVQKIVQDAKVFNVEGINSELSDIDREFIEVTNEELSQLSAARLKLEAEAPNTTPTKTFTTMKKETFTRKLLAADVDYTLEQQAVIFSHGKSDYKIWFLNKAKKLCLIESSEVHHGSVICNIMLDVKGYAKETKMTLDRFLYLVETNEFIVTNRKFVEYYLKPYTESKKYKTELEEYNLKMAEINNNIKKIKSSKMYKDLAKRYSTKKSAVNKLYRELVSDEDRSVAPDPAKMLKKKTKLDNIQLEIKTLWNSVVTEADKAYMMGWICKHIIKIDIKTVTGGVSDKVITTAYPDDVYGTKYREKANSSGWDASSGTIIFDTTEKAPVETIKSLSTLKHLHHTEDKGNTVFRGKEISNLDLALFLLTKYNKYGFKSGIKSLKDIINIEELKQTEFINYQNEFTKGYLGE